MNFYSGGALALFAIGVGRMFLGWREGRHIRATAAKILASRRAVYTEIPTHRPLHEGELVEERSSLDSVSRALPGFTTLADYVDEYPAGSRFATPRKNPLRVLVDRAGTTVALVFRPPSSDVVRIHLATEVSDGRWLLTENNKEHAVGKIVRPDCIEVVHVRSETSGASMIATHAERLAALEKNSESSTYRSEPLFVCVRSFEDYVASHERRWNAIRKHRREIGWVLRSEIQLAPGTPASFGDRIHGEIVRMVSKESDEADRRSEKVA